MLKTILKNAAAMPAVAQADGAASLSTTGGAATGAPSAPPRAPWFAALPLPRLEARAEPSRVMRYCSPLIAVLLTLIGGMLVFFALGKDPVAGFQVFFLNPL
ncbi:MAG TPA: hypothetical protein VFR86_20140, partial [Burkholderiaceae bacterium]|nr:hypothetical protein [Burkholderiaceae bacterium]